MPGWRETWIEIEAGFGGASVPDGGHVDHTAQFLEVAHSLGLVTNFFL